MLVSSQKADDDDAKTSKIEYQYFTTSDYYKFTSNTLNVKIVQNSYLMIMI